MAVKKSELYSTLWKCCDELRGGMDASQYKDYVLVILFVKYISDKSRSDEGFDIDIPGGCYFEDFVALKFADTYTFFGKKIVFGVVLAQLEHGRVLEFWCCCHNVFFI